MNRALWFANGSTAEQPVKPVGPLRGQFVMHVKGVMYGPRPHADDNVIFMGELDTLWLSGNRNAVETLLLIYAERGANHIVLGPAIRHGYNGQYPNANWIGQVSNVVALLDAVQARGMRVTLAALPDIAPYFTDRVGHDWALIARDFTDIYRVVGQHPAIVQIMNGYELLVPSAETARQGDYLRETFPNHPIGWHNPPGHLCPGLSDEDEQLCVRVAAAHGFTKLFLQASPPGSGTNRPPIDEMVYSIQDMRRRFEGVNSPWGAPVLGHDGKPLTVTYAEGVAYVIYNANYPDSIGAEWGQAAIAAGSIDCLDGLL